MNRMTGTGFSGAGAMHLSGIAWTASLHALAAALAWFGLSGPVTTPPVPIQVRFVELAPELPAPEPPKVAQFVPPPPKPAVPETVPEKPVVEKVPEKKPEKKIVRKKTKPPVAKKPDIAPKKIEPAAPAPVEEVAQAEAEPMPVPAAAPAPARLRPDPAPALASAAPQAPVIAPRFDAAYLRNPAPAYPRASRRLGEQGRVILRVCVEPDGRPSALEVHQSSGSARLDEAALKAVRQWSFVAARRGNENVTAWVLVPMDFRLKNS